MNSTDDCTTCTAGDYCGLQGQNQTSGPCDAGYYCPPGQNSSTPYDYSCTVGHYCPEGSAEPLPCQNGTYMNHTHAIECDVCPPAWYVELFDWFLFGKLREIGRLIPYSNNDH